LDLTKAATAQEERQRIVDEYARREREIPADRYSWAIPSNQLLHVQLWRECIDSLQRRGAYPLTGKKILDVGCGRGDWLLEFVQWGADPECVLGIDLVADRIAQAKKRLPQADIRLEDASAMPWESNSIDIATQFTVFSSVLDPAMRRRIAAEMLRVVKPGGLILWFDCAYDNPKNKNITGIPEAEVRQLFAGCEIEAWRSRLAPPIARLVGRFSFPLALMIEKLPFLRSHCFAVIRKIG
jgi:ubiquinone/menaquinone biosynthesis C-methylase UbiE